MKRVIIAAASSGSGKTTITCGLLKELKNRGLDVRAYKCGPDYIDPMFHKRVLGIPSENLDLFFSDAEYIKKILDRNSKCDISLIEGAMGIYDGMSVMGTEGSVYDLAVKTDTPVVLIMDVHGMGRTLISVLKGILSDDKRGLIKGVIFNRISDRFYESVKPLAESETGIRVLGHINRLKDVSIDSRHLGLKLPDEIKELEEQIEFIRENIAKSVDIDGLIEVAADDEKLKKNIENPLIENEAEHRPVLAVAMDEAFCFYYEENFRVIKEAGADIKFFSPLHDEHIPKDADGILIGGGYPELKLKELEANESMKISIRNAIDNGMPSLAECGGFMYLHDSISEDGTDYRMVGAVNGKCFNTGKLCRFGYVNVRAMEYEIKGHEFHYYDSTNNGSDGMAIKPSSEKSWEFGYIDTGRLWGFPHLYYGSCREFAADFVKAMRKYGE